METQEQTRVSVGDVIDVAGHRVGDRTRTGEILEILGSGETPHYRIRWEDGHESIFFPKSDSTIHRRDSPAAAVMAALRDADVEFEVLEHRRTMTAAAEARALGVLPQDTAKTVVVRADAELVRAVIPASERLDTTRLRDALGAKEIELVPEAEFGRLFPEFELGAVPPFGGARKDRVIVDVGLCGCEYVVFDAGVHDRSVRMRAADLLTVADAELAEVVLMH